MTDAPQTTEQEQWVLVDSRGRIVPESNLALVRVITDGEVKCFSVDVELALSDPANVYKVEAYPKVVQALRPIAEAAIESPQGSEVRETKHDVNLDYHVQMTITVGEARAIIAALSAVHPAEGGKG